MLEHPKPPRCSLAAANPDYRSAARQRTQRQRRHQGGQRTNYRRPKQKQWDSLCHLMTVRARKTSYRTRDQLVPVWTRRRHWRGRRLRWTLDRRLRCLMRPGPTPEAAAGPWAAWDPPLLLQLHTRTLACCLESLRRPCPLRLPTTMLLMAVVDRPALTQQRAEAASHDRRRQRSWLQATSTAMAQWRQMRQLIKRLTCPMRVAAVVVVVRRTLAVLSEEKRACCEVQRCWWSCCRLRMIDERCTPELSSHQY